MCVRCTMCRMAFPRFYFLSNDELLEILSQAKDPKAVQPHLRKCFDNLVKLEFGSEDGSADILAMYSGEDEKVDLGKNLKARGPVEEWLTAVERRMKDALHQCMKTGLIDYDTKARNEWVFCHPGQIVATVAQMVSRMHITCLFLQYMILFAYLYVIFHRHGPVVQRLPFAVPILSRAC